MTFMLSDKEPAKMSERIYAELTPEQRESVIREFRRSLEARRMFAETESFTARAGLGIV
jgi:hypothetical protein